MAVSYELALSRLNSNKSDKSSRFAEIYRIRANGIYLGSGNLKDKPYPYGFFLRLSIFNI
jgi:hypothetical protein